MDLLYRRYPYQDSLWCHNFLNYFLALEKSNFRLLRVFWDLVGSPLGGGGRSSCLCKWIACMVSIKVLLFTCWVEENAICVCCDFFGKLWVHRVINFFCINEYLLNMIPISRYPCFWLLLGLTKMRFPFATSFLGNCRCTGEEGSRYFCKWAFVYKIPISRVTLMAQ